MQDLLDEQIKSLQEQLNKCLRDNDEYLYRKLKSQLDFLLKMQREML